MRQLKYIIDDEYDGRKVLHCLRGGAGLSSRLIRQLKYHDDGITLNGVHTRTVDILHKGDVLCVNIPDDDSCCEKSEIAIDIVYEDEDILVINKPAGLAMHPTHNHRGDTLANAVAWYYADKGENIVFRAAGRLDKQTSGIVVCAKNQYAASRLNGKIKKTYFAVAGGLFSGSGVIDTPIIRPDPMKTLRATGEGGIEAVTKWEAVACDREKNRTLLRVMPLTGRTHQIRVHFASLGAPLAGDDMYLSTDTDIGRAALHCAKAELLHPVSGERMTFSAPLPEDMVIMTKSMSILD